MASLPGELIDAAEIDGSSQFRVLTNIMIPLSKPVIAVILIYTIVSVWNSWFSASIYLTKREFFPLQFYLKSLLNKTTVLDPEMVAMLPEGMLEKLMEEQMAVKQVQYAAIFLTAAPIIMVYPMFQKHFAKGVMLGSLKG